MVLHQRFGIKHSHIGDLMQMDRTTAYHAVKRAKQYLSVRDSDFVMSIQRWASILDEFEAEMMRVDSMLKHETTESIVYEIVKKHNREKSIEILQNVIKRLES